MLAINQRLASLVRPNSLRPVISAATNDHGIRTQKAGICHKSKLWADGRKPPYRWPYEKVPYNMLTALYDPITRWKMHENSKIIIIEGNVASGKGDFGRTLAEELDMKFMGQPDLDEIYINSYGFDYRSLNSLMPEHLRTCDLEMFHEQPNRHSVIHMQHYFQMMRGYQYLEALCHLLNTSQGVVIERSIFTERVFVESMHKMGWLPIGYERPDGCIFYDWRYRYNFIRKLFCRSMPAPHLTIFLDVPPEECYRRIQDGSDKVQANSNALTPEFLRLMGDFYERELLGYINSFGHLLRYDNTKGFDQRKVEDVIDDIELLDFTIDPHDTRFENWRYEDYKYWFFDWRRMASVEKSKYMDMFSQPYYDIAGLGDVLTTPDMILMKSIRENNVVGWDNDKFFDLRYNNLFKVLFGIGEYEKLEKKKYFADFP